MGTEGSASPGEEAHESAPASRRISSASERLRPPSVERGSAPGAWRELRPRRVGQAGLPLWFPVLGGSGSGYTWTSAALRWAGNRTPRTFISFTIYLFPQSNRLRSPRQPPPVSSGLGNLGDRLSRKSGSNFPAERRRLRSPVRSRSPSVNSAQFWRDLNPQPAPPGGVSGPAGAVPDNSETFRGGRDVLYQRNANANANKRRDTSGAAAPPTHSWEGNVRISQTSDA